MAKATKKRKRVVLSIEDKVKIVDLLDKSVSYTVIGEQYGIGIRLFDCLCSSSSVPLTQFCNV